VEGGVEARHRRHVGQRTADRLDPRQRRGLVERRQRHERTKVGHHRLVDHHRRRVPRPAVHHAVADRLHRGCVSDERVERRPVVRIDVDRGEHGVVAVEHPQLQAR
jgi:hypothetical protein